MGNSVAKVPDDEVKEIVSKTGFTKSQGKNAVSITFSKFLKVQNIYQRFLQLDKGSKGYLSRDDLSAIPEFAVNPLGMVKRDTEMYNPSVPILKDLLCRLYYSAHSK